jgi:hypothetical protein
MATQIFTGQRLTLTTSRSFADVVASLEAAVGHPNLPEFFRKVREARTPDDLDRVVQADLGPSGLMELGRFDFTLVLRNDRHPSHRKALRLILGNPLVMREMVRSVPDAGSYAPVTVLVDERDGAVQISYDRMASLLAPFGDAYALGVAQDLDVKVERLLYAAAGVVSA